MLKRLFIAILLLVLCSFMLMQGVKLNTRYLVKYKVYNENKLDTIDSQVFYGNYDLTNRVKSQYFCDSVYVYDVIKIK